MPWPIAATPQHLQDRPAVSTRNDPFIQRNPAVRKAPASSLSFPGYSNLDNLALFGGGVVPPDTNGDVSALHYIQYINLGWKIFSTADGSVVGGPFAGNVFWSGFGGSCETGNAGDPIVLYDELADRWLFSQFADPISGAGKQCFAISQTSDPLGPYDQYEFAVPGIDYPKIGIFTDGGSHSGYYFTTNNFTMIDSIPRFSDASLAVIDRDAMLAGDPTATFIEFAQAPGPQDLYFAVQPGHLEGGAAPPGSCNVFVQSFDDRAFGASTRPDDGYMFWLMCPDFTTPANATLSGPHFVSAGPGVDFDTELCLFSECIPQPGTAQLLETVSLATMYRASMRVGPSSDPLGVRMVVTHTVDVGGDQAGVRWVEFDINSLTDIVASPPSVVDQGTFAPDGHSRWLASAAMDEFGNIGIGYSLGSASKAPSIYFTGREVGDPAGQLQAESACVDGPGVQTGTHRWVDYSSMSVAPDGCTFWYTSEYHPVTDSFTWGTRVCSFSFPSCGIPRVVLAVDSGEPLQQVCAGNALSAISLTAALTTGALDPVTMGHDAPVGFTVGFAPALLDPSPGTTVVSISTDGSLATGVYAFNLMGTAAGFETGALGIGVDVLDPAPPAGAATLVSPPNGLLDSAVAPQLVWNAGANAHEYLVEVDDNADFSSPEFTLVTADVFAEVTPALAIGVAYNWRVTATSPCGSAAASAAWTFTTATPELDTGVLLVDDDNNAPDVRSAFGTALNDVGASFDVFDTGTTDSNEPSLAAMQPYAAVVWFTGDNYEAATGPSPASAAALSSYLDGGGCLLLSSPDYIWKTFGGEPGTATAFMKDYLGFGSFSEDTAYSSTAGSAGSPYAGLGPYVFSFPPDFSNFADALDVSPAGGVAFDDAGVPSATYVSNGTFHTLFTGFAFSTIPTAADRAAVMNVFMTTECGAPLGAVSRGDLSGTVTSAGSGVGLDGIEVTANRGGVEFSTVTDADGNYALPGLSPGFYAMAVSGANVASSPPAINVQVVDQQVTDQDFVVVLLVPADSADLSIVLAAGSATVLAGEDASFGITVSNAGPDVATGVRAVFGLPAGFSFVSAAGTDWSCVAAGATVTCDLAGTLVPSIASTLTLTLTVDAAALGVAQVGVAVSGDLADGNTTNNTDTADVQVLPSGTDIFSDGFEPE